MNRFRAAKRLDALDAQIDALLAERHALEISALGTEVRDDERRARYFAVADPETRRRLIGLERKLHDLRTRNHSAAVEYWTMVTAETRGKLDDVRSDSPTAGWRRDLWLDALTLVWILGGAGWLFRGMRGLLVGCAIAAIGAWFVARARDRARPGRVREGENALHTGESELRAAEQQAADAARLRSLFSATEEASGVPDGPA
jgi:hypothetical protein